jgi:hypothetical protein
VRCGVVFVLFVGGIGPKVIWRVNGRTQGTTAAPLSRGPLTLGGYIVMEQTLTVAVHVVDAYGEP